MKCRKCNNELNSDWKVCPFCITPIAMELKCLNCGMKLESDWEVCPNCSTPINSIENNKSTSTNEMIFVEGGTFRMGSNHGYPEERPYHSVTLSSFYISKYLVTHKEWSEIMEYNPAHTKDSNLPIDHISWYDAVIYCNKKSIMEGLDHCYYIDRIKQDPNNLSNKDLYKWTIKCDFEKNGYRLPTEAEWEFAARGGIYSSNYEYAGSNDIDSVAWYNGNSSESNYYPVGMKKPNELGIFDISGNVWEWCWDWLGSYNVKSQKDPKGVLRSRSKVVRGGASHMADYYCRVSYRDVGFEPSRYSAIGIRLVKRL